MTPPPLLFIRARTPHRSVTPTPNKRLQIVLFPRRPRTRIRALDRASSSPFDRRQLAHRDCRVRMGVSARPRRHVARKRRK